MCMQGIDASDSRSHGNLRSNRNPSISISWSRSLSKKSVYSLLRPDLTWRLFRQNALQRAPVHVETARRFRDIAAAKLVNPLNMLPPHPVGRHWIFWEFGRIVAGGHESIENFVGIDWLGQIIESPELYGGHGGSDIAIAGQDDAPRVRTLRLQFADHIEPVAVGKPHVDDREGGRAFADCRETFGDRVRGGHGEAARLHAAAKARQEGIIVVDDQERAIWTETALHTLIFARVSRLDRLGGGVFHWQSPRLNHFQDKTRQSKRESPNPSRLPGP